MTNFGINRQNIKLQNTGYDFQLKLFLEQIK